MDIEQQNQIYVIKDPTFQVNKMIPITVCIVRVHTIDDLLYIMVFTNGVLSIALHT